MMVGDAIRHHDLGQRLGGPGIAVSLDAAVEIVVRDDAGETHVVVSGIAVVAADRDAATAESADFDVVDADVAVFQIPGRVDVERDAAPGAGRGAVGSHPGSDEVQATDFNAARVVGSDGRTVACGNGGAPAAEAGDDDRSDQVALGVGAGVGGPQREPAGKRCAAGEQDPVAGFEIDGIEVVETRLGRRVVIGRRSDASPRAQDGGKASAPPTRGRSLQMGGGGCSPNLAVGWAHRMDCCAAFQTGGSVPRSAGELGGL